MAKHLINNNIQQYFCDYTYLCIPLTLRKYKMFVLSGFNLKEKKAKLFANELLADEKY